MVDFVEYKVAFEFMFCYVETFFENYPDDENVQLIYQKFFKVREEFRNGN